MSRAGSDVLHPSRRERREYGEHTKGTRSEERKAHAQAGAKARERGSKLSWAEHKVSREECARAFSRYGVPQSPAVKA